MRAGLLVVIVALAMGVLGYLIGHGQAALEHARVPERAAWTK
jgi:hypothetical protein